MIQVPIADPQNQWHTYAVNWTSAAITWMVDGVAVRTLNYNDAKGGTRFPQTPMRLRLGIWAGGDPTLPQGTITWAGGPTDFTKGPYTMSIDSTKVTNYSPASKYHYKDNSGSWQSVEVIGGNTGGIVSPGQQAVQNAAAPSSTDGQSTPSVKVPDLPHETGSDSGTNPFSNSTISTTLSSIATSSAAPSKTPIATSSSATSSGSKSSATAAKASSAASGLGGMRDVAGLSALSLLSLMLFG
jgi:beta-glucanase (GH16 family)